MRFEGRNVLVTGASRGIGAALSQRLAAEGARLVLVARTLGAHDHLTGSLTETAERCRAYGAEVHLVTADLSDELSRAQVVPAALDALGGRIDVLINNAGAAIYAPPAAFPLHRRRILFEVNVHAPMDLIQGVLPQMLERGEGWIVSLSSASARYEHEARRSPTPPRDRLSARMAVYGASKAALNRLSVAIAGELAGTGVRVNTVQPRAAVMTEGATALLGHDFDADLVEPIEAMVEGVLLLCDCAPESTGGVYDSLGLLESTGTTVMTLDGSKPYQAPTTGG